MPTWATALPIIAMQMNRTVHSAIKKTPYEVVFGQEMRHVERVAMGARASTEIPTEEESDSEPEEHTDVAPNEPENSPEEPVILSDNDSSSLSLTSLSSSLEPVQELQPNEQASASPDTIGQQLLTIRQRQRENCQSEVQANQSCAAAKMVTRYSKQHTIAVFEKGNIVSICIPRFDRGPLDDKRILGRIINVPRPDKYEVQTAHGIIEQLLPTLQLLLVPSEIQLSLPSGQAKRVSLHYIAAQEASSQVVETSCNCKKLCNSRRCACRNAGLKCSIACHKDEHDCQNLLPLAQRTEKGLRQRPAKRIRLTSSTVQ
jgi:hypothetical protein